MSILDNAVAHFKEKRGELRCVEVPEWGGKVYYYPAMNLQEKREIFKYFSGESIDLEGLAMALVIRARDEDGSLMFARPDRLKLMREVDSDVLSRVVNEMGMGIQTLPDAEKN